MSNIQVTQTAAPMEPPFLLRIGELGRRSGFCCPSPPQPARPAAAVTRQPVHDLFFQRLGGQLARTLLDGCIILSLASRPGRVTGRAAVARSCPDLLAALGRQNDFHHGEHLAALRSCRPLRCWMFFHLLCPAIQSSKSYARGPAAAGTKPRSVANIFLLSARLLRFNHGHLTNDPRTAIKDGRPQPLEYLGW